MTNREAAIKIIRRLRKEGFLALLAGGCVRDKLLKRPAKDYDVVTSASPDEVIQLFKRTLKVGAKFGVIMVLINRRQIEVATFRSESSYSDGRRPDSVQFCNPKEDATRRDFTINGMFYDPIEKKVIDYVAGQKDLRKKILRTIGSPQQRFGEDYLRMLRAVRFSTVLDFAIEEKTYKALCRLAGKITKISGERISMELEMILTNPNRSQAADLLIRTGLAKAIFPDVNEKNAAFGTKVLGHLVRKIDFPLALAGFFADCKTDLAMEACGILKLSNAHKKHLRFLLTKRDVLLDWQIPLARLKLLAGKAYFWDLYEFQRAIEKTRHRPLTPLLKIKKRADTLKGTQLHPTPLLDGHQLIDLGIRPGPMVGLVSREMYIAQLGEEIKTVNDAKKWLKRWTKKHDSRKQ